MAQQSSVQVATVRSAHPTLTPLFNRRCDEEGYKSLSAYFFALALYDVVLRKPHRVSHWFFDQPAEVQEQAVQAIVENFDSPQKPAGWFESRIREAAGEEIWRLHAQVRELTERNRELERELSQVKEELAAQRGDLAEA